MRVVPPALSTIAWFAYGSPMYYGLIKRDLNLVRFFGGEYHRLGSKAVAQAIERGRRLEEGQI